MRNSARHETAQDICCALTHGNLGRSLTEMLQEMVRENQMLYRAYLVIVIALIVFAPAAVSSGIIALML
jgi:hypothetical protein